ncbi:MAG: orotidine-5'-phosphate decarboxylase [Desulfovibrio sp.]
MSELVVALDFGSKKEALEMAEKLKGIVPWVKVGLELFVAEGPSLIEELKALEYKVFLDMKFFDIPNTVRGAVRSAAQSGADMMNIHVLGGQRMAEGALEGLRDAAKLTGRTNLPILLGVTILTSMGSEDMFFAQEQSVGTMVVDLASRGKEWGLDGVVCSGLEVENIKKACGAEYLCLTPGIRMPDAAGGDDQRRVVTPADAVKNGSDYLVMGRPITGADDPAAAAEAAIKNMNSA